VILLAALRFGRGAAMLNEQYRLGWFGDRRLDKGGRRWSKASSCTRVRACGMLPRASGLILFDMVDFLPILG